MMECFWRCFKWWATITVGVTLAAIAFIAFLFGVILLWAFVFGQGSFLAFVSTLLTLIGGAVGLIAVADKDKICKGEWP